MGFVNGRLVLYKEQKNQGEKRENDTVSPRSYSDPLHSQKRKKIWETPTLLNCNSKCHAHFQKDGNFVVFSEANTPLWSSNTFGVNNKLIISDQQPYFEIKNGTEAGCPSSKAKTATVPPLPPIQSGAQ